METEENKTVHKGLKKGLYLIPTAFTAANIAMGFFAVLYSIRGYQTVFTNPEAAAGYFNYAAIAIGLAACGSSRPREDPIDPDKEELIDALT